MDLTEHEKRMNEEAQKAIEAARRERQYNKCLRCEYASFTGTGLFCPVPYGTCMHERPGTEGGLEDGGCEVDQDHDGHI